MNSALFFRLDLQFFSFLNIVEIYFPYETYTFWKVESKSFQMRYSDLESINEARRTGNKRVENWRLDTSFLYISFAASVKEM